MARKKYRVTHNPYVKTTRVEEYYSGATNPWKILGGEKEPVLNSLLNKKESIQIICEDLLNELEKYNNKFPNCKQFEVLFDGIEQDFSDVEAIGEAFVAAKKNCNFTEFIKPEGFWDSAIIIQEELENLYENVKNIYSQEMEILQQIEEDFNIIDEKLNLLILGMQNSGKSTLINALLGKEILPTSDGVETAALYIIEQGEEDKVIIYPDQGSKMEISILRDKIEYNRIGRDLDRIVDNISHSDVLKEAKDSCTIIRTILKELNKVSREMQDDKNILFLKEVRIQLREFMILGNKQRICIKDFPGAGAKYLGEEHRRIVQEEIKRITNAVIVNVINADNSTYKNVYDFIGEIKSIDENKQGDIGGQIDFARSIYILNKAEVIKNWEEKERSVQKDLPNKKVIFCCAEAGFRITAKGEKAVIRKNPYGSDDENNVLNLQEHALLPKEYTKEEINKLTEHITKKVENGEALKNTGVILCAALIKEYADNFAAVNRTRCYYQAFSNMMKHLKEEEKRLEKEKEEEKKKKKEGQQKVRNELKEKCKDAVESYKKHLDTQKLKTQLGESTKENLNAATRCVNGLKEIKKEYKEQNKLIKKENKAKKKENKEAILTEKILWKEEVGNKIDLVIKAQYNDIKDKVNNLLSIHCEEVKKQVLNNIKAKNLTVVEEKEIKKIVRDYETPILSGDNYKMPEKFEFSWSISESFKRIFKHTEWEEEKIYDSITGYWADKILSPYADQLEIDIDKTLDKLQQHISERLDHFSPTLINLQKEIEEKERKLSHLKNNIEKSNRQYERCQIIIEKGVVHE